MVRTDSSSKANKWSKILKEHLYLHVCSQCKFNMEMTKDLKEANQQLDKTLMICCVVSVDRKTKKQQILYGLQQMLT